MKVGTENLSFHSFIFFNMQIKIDTWSAAYNRGSGKGQEGN